MERGAWTSIQACHTGSWSQGGCHQELGLGLEPTHSGWGWLCRSCQAGLCSRGGSWPSAMYTGHTVGAFQEVWGWVAWAGLGSGKKGAAGWSMCHPAFIVCLPVVCHTPAGCQIRVWVLGSSLVRYLCPLYPFWLGPQLSPERVEVRGGAQSSKAARATPGQRCQPGLGSLIILFSGHTPLAPGRPGLRLPRARAQGQTSLCASKLLFSNSFSIHLE